ncbi:hypothetical protein N7519_006711 [Penicillium mononematosum]|uniref:uncharacterized protein n=1 Tax=Penicillium mononematosum TaxID=268346 RepID=UPI00254847FF|nr:uncharacterized protein N7519_006711 [Penicillium mononematosum]KAJ6185410.1 hypothetical protein N7519_006711 [Penicillium mononematosum]
MAEKKKGRKRSKIKRWLRSWVFTPLGNVKIKLINKVERKRRSIPDWDFKRIVSGALTDRYPCRFFRGRNDRQASSPGKSVSPETDYPHNPGGSWRGDEHCVLRIMNPDMSVSSSEDGKSGELGPISVFQVDRNVYELSALEAMSPDLPAELSGEEKQRGQSHSVLAESDVGMVNLSVEELAPLLPALYFIHQPDPPLCCLITAALRDCSSPVLFENGICSYAHSSHGIEPVIQHIPSSDMPRSSIKRAQPRMTATEFLIRQTQRKGDAIVNNRYISPFAPLRQPLITRKKCNVIAIKRNDALLRRKILNGPLPPLSSSTSCSNQATTSSTPRSSPSPAIDDLPQYPDRPTSMCGGCLAGRHRALHSHPYYRGDNSAQFGNPPLPYPLSPRELSRLEIDVDGFPTSLRAGPQCRHCSTRRSGLISPPVLVGPRALNRVSSSFSDTAPGSPLAGPVGDNSLYATSAGDLTLVIDTDRIYESVGSSGLEMCLIAGSAAQKRRYR